MLTNRQVAENFFVYIQQPSEEDIKARLANGTLIGDKGVKEYKEHITKHKEYLITTLTDLLNAELIPRPEIEKNTTDRSERKFYPFHSAIHLILGMYSHNPTDLKNRVEALNEKYFNFADFVKIATLLESEEYQAQVFDVNENGSGGHKRQCYSICKALVENHVLNAYKKGITSLSHILDNLHLISSANEIYYIARLPGFNHPCFCPKGYPRPDQAPSNNSTLSQNPAG